jgi:hypothetical protein
MAGGVVERFDWASEVDVRYHRPPGSAGRADRDGSGVREREAIFTGHLGASWAGRTPALARRVARGPLNRGVYGQSGTTSA